MAAADCRANPPPYRTAHERTSTPGDCGDGFGTSLGGAVVSAGAAGAVAAAAAAQARRRREEEESMASYTPEELAEGFEFKILRSATGRFKDPDFLRQRLQEEAPAGWTLLEKFDDQRVRLKRPAAARRHDATLQVDPYRTSVGTTETALAVRILLVVGGTIALILLIVFMATRR
jgi:hypothetical protein